MEVKEEIYNYVQDCLKSNILPSAHEISKICESKYIKKEDVIKLIDSTAEEIKKDISDDDEGLIDFGISQLADKLKEELQK